jgi:hypothetical protein
MKNINSEFFDKLDKIVSEADDYQEKADFVKTFFDKNLGIDDIEDTMINLGRMRTKTFYYLILSAIIEYGSMLENIDRYFQDIFNSEDFTSTNDSSEAKRRLGEKLARIDRKIFYLFIGQIDPQNVDINAAEEINYYRSEMGRIVGEMTKDTLIVFTSREKQLILNLLYDIITDDEINN